MCCIPPVVSFNKHTGHITPPIATDPSQTLMQVFGTVFERGLHFSRFVILHRYLPVMGVQPSSNEIVVICIKLICAPSFVGEAKCEGIILKDTSTVRHRPARQTRQAAINMQTGGTIEISSFQVQRSEKAPQSGLLRPHESLRCSHTTHLLIFKRGEYPLEQGRRPYHVVVGKDCDSGLDVGDGLAHLTSLVGFWYGQNLNSFAAHGRRHLHGPLGVAVNGDDDDLVRLGRQTCPNGAAQLLSVARDGGDNNRNIIIGVARIGRNGNGLEGPIGYYIHN